MKQMQVTMSIMHKMKPVVLHKLHVVLELIKISKFLFFCKSFLASFRARFVLFFLVIDPTKIGRTTNTANIKQCRDAGSLPFRSMVLLDLAALFLLNHATAPTRAAGVDEAEAVEVEIEKEAAMMKAEVGAEVELDSEERGEEEEEAKAKGITGGIRVAGHKTWH